MGTKWPTCRVNLYFGDSEIWGETGPNLWSSTNPTNQTNAAQNQLHPPVKRKIHFVQRHLPLVDVQIQSNILNLQPFHPEKSIKIRSTHLKSSSLPQFFHGSPVHPQLSPWTSTPTPPSARGATTPAAARQCRRRRWRRRSAPQQGHQGQRRPAARSPGAAALVLCFFFDKVYVFVTSGSTLGYLCLGVPLYRWFVFMFFLYT